MPWQDVPAYQPSDFLYDNWSKHLAPAFQQALQGIYGRGLDVSAPDSLVDAAFPRSSSATLLQGHTPDLLRGAQMFMGGQAPQRPDMVRPNPLWYEESGSGTDSGVSPANAMGQVTGFDPTTAMIALQAAAAVPGTGMVGTIAGIPGILSSLAQTFGFDPNFGLPSNMTQNTPEGPINVSATYTGLINALSNAINGRANFVSVDPTTGQTMPAFSQNEITMGTGLGPGHPAFGGQGFNAMGEGPTGGGGKGYGGYGGLSGDPNAPGAINFGFAQARGDEGNPGPPGPPADAAPTGPPGSDDGGMGGVSSGAAAGSSAGTASGDSSTGGDPGGSTYKKGGVVKDVHKGFARKKGSEVVPIKAHEGEFVVNKEATKAARPALQALNALIPPPPRSGKDLASMIKEAAKYFDVA